MTTLTSTTPSTGSETAAAPVTPVGASELRSKSSRLPLWLAGSVLAAALLGVLGWSLASWSRSALEASKIQRFTVEPRTFSVVLKEKGELQAAKSTEIICEVEGRSTIISLVSEGTAVKKGDLLVELASDQIEDRIRQEELKEANSIMNYEAAKAELEIQRDRNASDIRKADLQIELRQLEFEKYDKGDWVQSLKDAEIAIQQAEINLERRKEDFDAAERLYQRDFMTKTEYEEDKFNHQKALWELDKATKSKEVLEKYTHVAELRQRESDLQEAVMEAQRAKKSAAAEEIKKVRALEGKKKELDLIQDQLAKLRIQKGKCRIHAPTPGFVVYYSGGGGRHFMSSDNQIREGATVHERQVLLTLPDTSKMIVIVRVHEAKTDRLALGQQVSLQVEGLPGRRLTGSVTKIAMVADTQNRWLNPDLKEYQTEITLDPTDAPLKPGVTAHAEILVERVEADVAVPVQSVYTKSGRRYVFTADRNGPHSVAVELGAIGTEWAQVTSGLSGGEKILLAFSDEHKRLIPDDPTGGRRSGITGPGQGAGRQTKSSRPPGARNPHQSTPKSHAAATPSASQTKPTAQHDGTRQARRTHP